MIKYSTATESLGYLGVDLQETLLKGANLINMQFSMIVDIKIHWCVLSSYFNFDM